MDLLPRTISADETGCRPIGLLAVDCCCEVVSVECGAVECPGLCRRCLEGVGEARGLDPGLGEGDTLGLPSTPLLCSGRIAVGNTPADLVGDVCCRGQQILKKHQHTCVCITGCCWECVCVAAVH